MSYSLLFKQMQMFTIILYFLFKTRINELFVINVYITKIKLFYYLFLINNCAKKSGRTKVYYLNYHFNNLSY